MSFTPEQHSAIFSEGSLAVVAGAGSGKTRVLVERYLRLLEREPAERLLAITFTEKAARELNDRVRQAVEARARAALRDPATPHVLRERWLDRLAAIEGARIGTIHSFCAALLRAHPAETGLDPAFTLLDEVEAALLQAESVETALESVLLQAEHGIHSNSVSEAVSLQHPAPSSRLGPGFSVQRLALSVLEAFGLDELRDLLSELLAQNTALPQATSAEELLVRWRSAREQTQRATWQDLLADSRWADGWRELVALADGARANDKLGVQVLRLAPLAAQIGPTWREDTLPLATALERAAEVNTIDLRGGARANWPNQETLARARQALQGLRQCYRDQQELLELGFDQDFEAQIAQAALGLQALLHLARAHYQQAKTAREALDFDDLEREARALLEGNPAVRARWQAELAAVLVDEFQDTNDNQRAIVYALTGLRRAELPGLRTESGQLSPQPSALSPELFVVGDGKQSIYRFRGADVSVFTQVQRDLQHAGGLLVALDTSFRSHPPLIELVNQIAAPIFARRESYRPFEVPFAPLRALRAAPTHSVSAELHLYTPAAGTASDGRSLEASLLAARIKALVAGEGQIVYDERNQRWRTPQYGDFALLFQASTVFEHYERALAAAGIPFLTTAGRGYYGRNEVRDLVHLLRALDDPADELALAGALRSPLFALPDEQLLWLRLQNPHSLWQALLASGADDPPELTFARTVLHDLSALRGRVTVVELLRAALEQTGYLATISGLPDGKQRRVNVEKLLSATRQAGALGLSQWSGYLERLLRQEPREGDAPLEGTGSVRLMTVHRSKGLEFPIVALPDLGRKAPRRDALLLADRELGLALKLRDNNGDWQPGCAYALALQNEQLAERAERQRLLYVALTRAQDYLLLSGPTSTSTHEDWLSALVAALGCPWEQGGPPEQTTVGALCTYYYTQ